MRNRLLRYEFWKEDGIYYRLPFDRVLRSDLNVIRSAIADNINRIPKKEVLWLDIGSGDGSALLDILKGVRGKKINLYLIEPSKFAIKLLKKRFSHLTNIKFTIFNNKFHYKLIERLSFDCITLLHSNYYLASSKNGFQKIYTHLYNSLRKSGVLLVQSVADDSDFQKLGNPPYSEWSLGNKTSKLIKKLWPTAKFEKLPTHFDATDYLEGSSKKIKEEILHFYRFLTQKENAHPSAREIQKFISKIKDLASKKDGKYLLDFKDCIVTVEK